MCEYRSIHITFNICVCVYVCIADRIGKAILAGGSAFGIASLCVYGLGLTNETGAIDRMG